MDHRVNRLEIAKCLAALVAMTVSLPKQLRPYQMETIVSMIRWLGDSGGSRRAYVAHATGMGKTTLFASMITACAGLRILVVVPSKVLVEQTVRELYTFTGGLIGHVSSLNKIKDDDGEVIAMKGHDLFDVVVVTDASLARHGRKLAKEFNPHLVIRDECHWTYAEKRQKVMDFYSESVTVGFSATPDYLTTQARSTFVPVTLDNGQVLYAPEDRIARAHYSTCLDERAVRWGIEEGYLAPLAWGHVEFDISLDDLRTADGDCGPDFREEDLHALLEKKWQFMQDTIVELYKSGEYGLRDRQVFAVCHGVEAADRLAVALRGIGVSSACITGKTRDIERNAILSAFQSGAIKFLSSVMVLREGWNAPNAEVCLMLRPTKSRVFYVQSMGRVLRPSEDGSAKVALVIDALYQNTAFAPLSAPVLFGYPGQEVSSGDILINAHGDASRVQESPYKTGLVRPKLVTVEAIEVEQFADEEGKIVLEGVEYYPCGVAAEKLSLSSNAIQTRLDSAEVRVRSIQGRSRMLHRRTFYAIEDIRAVCADLLDAAVMSEPGTLVQDGKMFKLRGQIAINLDLNRAIVIAAMNKAKVKSIEGKSGGGRIEKFYDFESAKSALSPVLMLKRVDTRNLVCIDDKDWYTAQLIESKFGVPSKALRIYRHRHKGRISTLEVYDSGGAGVVLLYCLADVRAAFPAVISDVRLDSTGKVKVRGQVWVAKTHVSTHLDLSYASVYERLKNREYEIRVIDAVTQLGKPVKALNLTDLKLVFADLIDRPRTDKDGLAQHKGHVWALKVAISTHYSWKLQKVMHWLKKLAGDIRTIQGRDDHGTPQTLYNWKDVQVAFKKLPSKVLRC